MHKETERQRERKNERKKEREKVTNRTYRNRDRDGRDVFVIVLFMIAVARIGLIANVV